MLHVCTVCGYQYDDNVEKKGFADLPDNWTCPVCNALKSAFGSIDVDYNESDG